MGVAGRGLKGVGQGLGGVEWEWRLRGLGEGSSVHRGLHICVMTYGCLHEWMDRWRCSYVCMYVCTSMYTAHPSRTCPATPRLTVPESEGDATIDLRACNKFFS